MPTVFDLPAVKVPSGSLVGKSQSDNPFVGAGNRLRPPAINVEVGFQVLGHRGMVGVIARPCFDDVAPFIVTFAGGRSHGLIRHFGFSLPNSASLGRPGLSLVNQGLASGGVTLAGLRHASSDTSFE